MIEQHSAHGPFDIEDIEDLGHSQAGVHHSAAVQLISRCSAEERAASPRPDLDQHVAEACRSRSAQRQLGLARRWDHFCRRTRRVAPFQRCFELRSGEWLCRTG